MLNIEGMLLSVPTYKCMFFMIITNQNHDFDASHEPFHGNTIEKSLKRPISANSRCRTLVQNGRSWSMTHKPWFMVKNEPSIGIVMAENGVSIKMNGPETKADCTKVHRTRWKWTVVFDMNWKFLFMNVHFDRPYLNMFKRVNEMFHGNRSALKTWSMAHR